MNEAFWRNPDGPVFLYIGGEGPIFEYDLLAGRTGRSLRQDGGFSQGKESSQIKEKKKDDLLPNT